MTSRSQAWLAALGALGAVILSAGVAGAAGMDNPATLRGSQIAQARCAGCHAVALEAASPVHDAPLFRVLSRLYAADRLEMKLLDLAENGHFEMPRVRLSEDEAADVAAYIASLETGAVNARPCGRPAVANAHQVPWRPKA